MSHLNGVCAALCTAVSEDAKGLDESAFRTHIDRMIDNGVHIISVCGGTGEFPFLSRDERLKLSEIAAEQIDGRAKLIYHASATNTPEAIEFAKHGESLGADALLLLPPYFEGPDLDGVKFHYQEVASATSVEIMVYNIPVHTGIDITPDFYTELSKIEKINYIKDSTGDFLRIQELLLKGAKVFNGADPLMFDALLAGAVGCFWGGSNVMPQLAVQLYSLTTSGQLAEARNLWEKMLPANHYFWSHAFNPAIKAGANFMGHQVGPCRLPVQPLPASEKAELEAMLTQLKEAVV